MPIIMDNILDIQGFQSRIYIGNLKANLIVKQILDKSASWNLHFIIKTDLEHCILDIQHGECLFNKENLECTEHQHYGLLVNF